MPKDQTRWLSVEEQEIWRTWLLGTARIQSFLDADLRRFGFDLAEYEILVALSESENGRLRMSELAELVHQSRSRLTHTIKRLEERGCVTRMSCAADGRGVWAEMTDPGMDLLREMAPRHVEAVRRILVDAVDPADLAAMGRAMSAVLAVAD